MCQEWHQMHRIKYRQTPLEHSISTTKRPGLTLWPISIGPSKLTWGRDRIKLNPVLMKIWHLTQRDTSKLPSMVNVKGRIRTAKISSSLGTVHTVTTACTAMSIEWWIRSRDIDTTRTWPFSRAYSTIQRTKADLSMNLILKRKSFQYLREYMLRVTSSHLRHLRNSIPALSLLLSPLIVLMLMLTAAVDQQPRVKWLFHNIGFKNEISTD